MTRSATLVKVSDPRQSVGYFYYDKLNRLVLQVDPEGYATATTYSLGGQALTVTRYTASTTGAAVGAPPTLPVVGPTTAAVTALVRDKLDRLTQITDAEGKSETYTLDAFGNRTSVKNKVDGITTYTYDRHGLVLSETLPVISFQLDGPGRRSSTASSMTRGAIAPRPSRRPG